MPLLKKYFYLEGKIYFLQILCSLHTSCFDIYIPACLELITSLAHFVDELNRRSTIEENIRAQPVATALYNGMKNLKKVLDFVTLVDSCRAVSCLHDCLLPIGDDSVYQPVVLHGTSFTPHASTYNQ